MKVWVGHYRENPNEWFVVWAESKDEAFYLIDPLLGEPDMVSFRELEAPGFVNFSVVIKGEKRKANIHLLPSKADVESGYWLVLDEESEMEDTIKDYVLSLVRKEGDEKKELKRIVSKAIIPMLYRIICDYEKEEKQTQQLIEQLIYGVGAINSVFSLPENEATGILYLTLEELFEKKGQKITKQDLILFGSTILMALVNTDKYFNPPFAGPEGISEKLSKREDLAGFQKFLDKEGLAPKTKISLDKFKRIMRAYYEELL